MKLQWIRTVFLRLLCTVLGWTILLVGSLLSVLLIGEFGVSLRGILLTGGCLALTVIPTIALITAAQRLRLRQQPISACAASDSPSAASDPLSPLPAQPSPEQTAVQGTAPADASDAPCFSPKLLHAVLGALQKALQEQDAPISLSSRAPRDDQRAAYLIRSDAADGTKLRLMVGVHPVHSDLFLQHYLFAGTKEELLAYLAADATAKELEESISHLSDALWERD